MDDRDRTLLCVWVPCLIPSDKTFSPCVTGLGSVDMAFFSAPFSRMHNICACTVKSVTQRCERERERAIDCHHFRWPVRFAFKNRQIIKMHF